MRLKAKRRMWQMEDVAEAVVSILHVGGSGLWSSGCRTGDDDTTRQHPERPDSPL